MRWTYTRGLHDLGNNTYAWLAPDGGWGWSNAGLIVDGEESLLVDTLFVLAQTREMLEAMRRAEPAAAKDIGTLVNTHANGDHCNGNQLVEGAEIIASAATAEEMNEFPPEALAELQRALKDDDSSFARYFNACFSDFDFNGITLAPPTRTFRGEMTLTVGDKRVDLIEVGPAHTRGDVLIHVPDDRTLFTGDILFIEGTPLAWAGPIRNWIDACHRIEAMDLETIVPGHGPITDRNGVANVRRYFEYIETEARARYDSGLSVEEAARDIDLGEFAGWGERERIVVNVNVLYREFVGDESEADIMALFATMAGMAGY